MDIDIERLKVDESVWPDGAQWFGPDEGRFFAGFYKSQDGKVYFMSADDDEWQLIYPMPRRTIISRPKAPEAEWDGDGEPPIGCEIKVWFNSAGAGCWERGEVIAQDGNMTVVKVNGAYYGRNTGGDLMAPIRTKQERQRDELANSVEAGMRKCGFVPSPTDCKIVAVELLSRYNLEPKP